MQRKKLRERVLERAERRKFVKREGKILETTSNNEELTFSKLASIWARASARKEWAEKMAKQYFPGRNLDI